MDYPSGSFRRLDVQDLPPDASVLIIGQDSHDTSTIIQDIILHFQKKTVVIGNEQNPIYHANCIGRIVEYKDGYSGKILEELLPKNTDDGCCWGYAYDIIYITHLLLSICSPTLEHEFTESKCQLLVMDNCLEPNSVPPPDDIFTGRFNLVVSTLSTKNPFYNSRSTIYYDYIFLFYDNDEDRIFEMYEKYGRIFPDYKTFKCVFSYLTHEHEALVIVPTGGDDIRQRVYWYKPSSYKY